MAAIFLVSNTLLATYLIRYYCPIYTLDRVVFGLPDASVKHGCLQEFWQGCKISPPSIPLSSVSLPFSFLFLPPLSYPSLPLTSPSFSPLLFTLPPLNARRGFGWRSAVNTAQWVRGTTPAAKAFTYILSPWYTSGKDDFGYFRVHQNVVFYMIIAFTFRAPFVPVARCPFVPACGHPCRKAWWWNFNGCDWVTAAQD